MLHVRGKTDLQLTAIYLAPDIIPQGKIEARFSVDAGVKKNSACGPGELFGNATHLFNTLLFKKKRNGVNFRSERVDYYETQVFQIGYAPKL